MQRRPVRGDAVPTDVHPSRLFRTVAPPGGYPADGAHGNVWYCEELSDVTFDETVAAKGLTPSVNGDTAYVYVLDGRYVAEGTTLICEEIDGYWFSE